MSASRLGKTVAKGDWKDTSSHRQGDSERIPNSWELRVGDLRICVHRHFHYEPDQWLLFCPHLQMADVVLKSKDTGKAQKEAIQFVKNWLKLQQQFLKGL